MLLGHRLHFSHPHYNTKLVFSKWSALGEPFSMFSADGRAKRRNKDLLSDLFRLVWTWPNNVMSRFVCFSLRTARSVLPPPAPPSLTPSHFTSCSPLPHHSLRQNPYGDVSFSISFFFFFWKCNFFFSILVYCLQYFWPLTIHLLECILVNKRLNYFCCNKYWVEQKKDW